MKTAHLYYFSGTGVTGLVAQAFARGLEARGYEVRLLPIEELVRGERGLPTERPDLAGFGAPVIGFGTPRLVRRFLRGLPRADGVQSFVFRTAGGAGPVNARASAPLLRALRRKGYANFYERCFSIASNWIAPHEASVVHRLLHATEAKVEASCDELLAGRPRVSRVGFGGKILLDLLRGVSGPGIRLIGRDLGASAECKACGLCARRCPAANIVLKDGRPRFGRECTTCLRCLYACPRRAISPKHFRSVAIPQGFDLARTLEEAERRQGEPASRVPPFLSTYEAAVEN